MFGLWTGSIYFTPVCKLTKYCQDCVRVVHSLGYKCVLPIRRVR